MRFKLLYTSLKANQKLIAVMDIEDETIIEFTLDELQKDNLSLELKEYVHSIQELLNDKNWEYPK